MYQAEDRRSEFQDITENLDQISKEYKNKQKKQTKIHSTYRRRTSRGHIKEQKNKKLWIIHIDDREEKN